MCCFEQYTICQVCAHVYVDLEKSLINEQEKLKQPIENGQKTGAGTS